MKTQQINIRLSIYELYQIDKLAKEANLTRTDYMIRRALNRRVSKIVVDTEPLKNANLNLSRIGGNLNQIARAMNRYAFSENQIQDCLETLKEVKRILPEFRNLLIDIRKEIDGR